MRKSIRRIVGTICAFVVLGLVLLCQVHALIQLVTGLPFDTGDWIGVITLAMFVLLLGSEIIRRKRQKIS